ncbi:MAG TPA: hypothetical protein VFQ05_16430 [Candidatus Eisenbacteria bacterium]|nr:hypothetical protein [Candidatus Eisenbacteria bacterium]
MRKPALLLVMVLQASAESAYAKIPSAALSTVPPGITVVGGTSGTADPLGSATFVLRDAADNPLLFQEVVLDFSACSDVRLSPDMADPGIVVDCANKTVRGVTDLNGSVTFRAVGSASGPPRSISKCLAVRILGAPFFWLSVSADDLNGSNGVNLMDVSMAVADVHSGHYRARSDYDFDGQLDLIDISVLLRAVYAGGSTVSGLGCAQ